ncbi:hypothetical protein LRL17_30080 (plasmid) [Rhodococcus qingshengii]|uniref:hypothetical protein n=1 Tax=Rhodococcus qingshengii TaxID=334542 RepID=UPI001E3FB649|nr:hypothetical protein [Rhodococcus qingshengii]UGQ55241.1 hypothetical protein LRL17_30080 [Rhodococcus qingshengii]
MDKTMDHRPARTPSDACHDDMRGSGSGGNHQRLRYLAIELVASMVGSTRRASQCDQRHARRTWVRRGIPALGGRTDSTCIELRQLSGDPSWR